MTKAPDFLLPAISPVPGTSNFPLPQLVQSTGPLGVITYEGPTINGIPMPGQWLLVSATREFGWQEQKEAFKSGAVLVPTGDPLLVAEYDIRIWEDAAAGLFRKLQRTLLKKGAVSIPGKPASAALGIHDPALKDVGVISVVTLHMTPLLNPLVTSGGRGPWTAKIAFKEYRNAQDAMPIPNQSIPDPGAVTPSAATNMATANAAVTAGAAKLQSAAAAQLLNRH